ncbi:MAG: hypothetical protein QW161_05190 [Candidatus Bathyarchaeia archaeon]
MSVFDPVQAVLQLLSENMTVMKDERTPANILFSREWVEGEALPAGVDGHVTVGLAESVDQKLELSGRFRRRVLTLRVNVWSFNRVIRQKMVEEVLRVVRENRKNPGGSLDYLDVASYRDLDRVDVKPVIYRTELVLKSWVFEDVGV